MARAGLLLCVMLALPTFCCGVDRREAVFSVRPIGETLHNCPREVLVSTLWKPVAKGLRRFCASPGTEEQVVELGSVEKSTRGIRACLQGLGMSINVKAAVNRITVPRAKATSFCNRGIEFLLEPFYAAKPLGVDGRKIAALSGPIRPTESAQLLQSGSSLYYERKFATARELYMTALVLNPMDPRLWTNLGFVMVELRQYAAGLSFFEEALRIDRTEVQVDSQIGQTLLRLNQPKYALSWLRVTAKNFPQSALVSALLAQAVSTADAGPSGQLEALRLYKQSLVQDPSFASSYVNMGSIQLVRGLTDESISSFEKSIQMGPTPEAYMGLGSALMRKKKYKEAIESCNSALKLNPKAVECHFNSAVMLAELGQRPKAIRSYKLAIEGRPGYFQAMNNLAALYQQARSYTSAIQSFRSALKFASGHFQTNGAITPQTVNILANLVDCLSRVCDWKASQQHIKTLVTFTEHEIRENKTRSCVDPFSAMLYPFSPETVRDISSSFAYDVAKKMEGTPRPRMLPNILNLRGDGRLHVGYLSSNFGNHTVTYAMQSVFGMHDRQRFRCTCYSIGLDDSSHWFRKVERECERFVRLQMLTNTDAAARVAGDGVHVLVNMNGHTRGNRNEIFALRPAPIHVLFYGFVNTFGGSMMEYVISDARASPPEYASLYTEKVAAMPSTFFITDYRQSHWDVVHKSPPRRSDFSVPGDEDTVLFCSFNQMYKITPDLFKTWVSILKQVPNSLLWLPKFPPEAEPFLKRNIEEFGLKASRLFFTPVLSHEEHMFGKRLCSVFLDPHLFNSHTTGADILWIGVPAVTWPGTTMASRVGLSLAAAIGVQEFVARSEDEYVRLAVSLATDENKRKAAVRKLVVVRDTAEAVLFDTARWVRDVERVFAAMWEVHVSGAPRSHFRMNA